MTTTERTSNTAAEPTPAEHTEHQATCSVGVFHDTQWPPCPNPATWEMVAHDCQAPTADITGYLKCQICDQHAELARRLPAPMQCKACNRTFAEWRDWFRTLHRL